MVAPLVPYAIRGAIWYQGEGNAGRAYQYESLLPAMIQGWRRAWRQGDFPFLLVQLPNYRARRQQPAESDWAELREAQLKTLQLPNTGMAVTIDLGEADDVHPRDKRLVGERLARWALGPIYGVEPVYSGPVYKSMHAEGSNIRIQFKHIGSGLTSLDNQPLRGFAVAGEDRRFVWADARIDGGTVVVSSREVKTPVAVRYAWADNPDCNLGNLERLPASPFRTDEWPGVTHEQR
jgi:sialate O-acetylesterase